MEEEIQGPYPLNQGTRSASRMQADSLKNCEILHNVDTSDLRKVFVLEGRALMLENKGTIVGIGINERYLLANSNETACYSNAKIISERKFKDLTTNGEHALAISEEGFLHSWGANEHGQLGRDGRSYPVLLVAKVFGVRIKEAACGKGYSCVLTEDGKVLEWGIYGFNEIVLESHSELDKPDEAEEKEKIVSIHGTKNYLMILTESGKVFIPPFKRSINKCDQMTSHVEKVNALEGPLKNKKVKQVLSGKSYSFALTCDGEIFHWSVYTCSCHNQPEPKRLAEEIEQVNKIWASTSHDVLVAANNIGNLYSITWKGPGILLSISQINFPSAGSYFANLGMVIQGPMYDNRSADIIIKENADVLNEWRGRFNAAFNKKEGSDITFIVGEGIIYAHRAILSIQSSYLNAIFNNDWKEKSENNQVVIKEYSYPTYLRFMKFLYTGKLELSSHESTLELLKLAHEYMEKPLLDMCKNMAIQGLTTENAFTTYNVANLLGLEDVRLACKGLIGRNLEDVILSEDIFNQDEALLLRCIRDMVCSKDIVGQKGN